jgi:E3 ubiquitin-protein ligase HUWE1
MDSAFTWILKSYSQNLLLLPSFGQPKEYPAAGYLAEIQQCPTSILRHTQVIMQFSALLLRNSTSKHLYASVAAVADLMAAADDVLADVAVATLTALSLPPARYAMPGTGGDPPILMTQLHQSQSLHKSDVQDRLLCTARAWGSRALGLGLFVTVTADDSQYGQGALPVALGEVCFSYTRNSTAEDSTNDTSLQEEITLTVADMQLATDSMYTSSPSPDHSVASSPLNEADADNSSAVMAGTSKKRRKVTSALNEDNSSSMQHSKKRMRSTAELFFLAVERANDGQLENVPTDRWFSLLAEIRLARSFHSQADRYAAVLRRLQALTAVLNSHPFNDVMTGYFEAQPELCVDIVDLLRPLVSAASVSAVSSSSLRDVLRPDAIENLVSDTFHDGVPFALRVAALEALTALVSRRENSSSQISGYGRLTSVLSDMGVGKGQYLGLLPTLIRYSLAALGSVMDSTSSVDEKEKIVASDAFSIGLAFVEATVIPPISRKLQSVRALRFIDRMLTLTNAVVSSSQGLAALVDCGLIPALLTTVSLHPEEALRGLVSGGEVFSSKEVNRIRASFRLITAQALHILETVIVAHPNSMATFQDLNGVDILINRLSWEVDDAKNVGRNVSAESDMDVDDSDIGALKQKLSSQRIVIFCILTCLTAVFHQDSSNSEIAPIGGVQLRKKEFTEVLLEVLNNVASYGGHLASLVSTLLSDIMNGDPHVVEYVLSCGLADSFLNLVVGERTLDSDGKHSYLPKIPPCPELIMAIPNVIAALSLTEDGAKLVADRNPFPCFLRLVYHPDYAMPRSRCLLNEMTSIIGTGLDEIVRHVEILKPLVLAAIIEGMDQVIVIATNLSEREERSLSFMKPISSLTTSTEQERSCLIQYILNFAQLLEQFLHNDENCEPFVNAGGLDSVLSFFPLSMPPPGQFLSFVSSMSSPTVSTLLHSTTEEALNVVCKCIEMRYDSLKLLRKLVVIAEQLFVQLDETISKLTSGVENSLNFTLDVLPCDPLYVLAKSDSHEFLLTVSHFLRTVSSLQWITNLIGNALKAKSGESSWGRVEKEWKAEVASDDFCRLIDRIGAFHRASLFEVCRVRAEQKFEEIERARLEERSSRLRYLLRIVCTEGAVVRDGIEIDLCANVGSLEMGDIVESFDRCMNSSGILRYRTRSGWVSEMTRGHGREPIAEVIRVWEGDDESEFDTCETDRVEMGVLGLRSVAVSILARGQASSAEFYGALSKLVVQGVRTLPLPLTFDEGSAGACVASMAKVLADNLKQSLRYEAISPTVFPTFFEQPSSELRISEGGAAMYLSAILSQLHSCLFDDKRERRIVNVPLLVSLVVLDSDVNRDRVPHELHTGALLFDVVGFIFQHGFSDFSLRYDKLYGKEITEQDHLRTSRSVASSFPPVISLFRKLSSTPMTSSPVASIMSRLRWNDISLLLGIEKMEFLHIGVPDSNDFFHPESFVADFMLSMSSSTHSVWCDERIRFVPPYLVHPISGLIGDIMVFLEDLSKRKSTKSVSNASERMRLSEVLRLRPPDDENELFEVSEDLVLRLVEMGFTSEQARHALESTRSNSLETAMEYALSNDPPIDGVSVQQRAEVNEMTEARDVNIVGMPNDPDEQGNRLSARSGDSEALVATNENKSGITFDALARVELKKWVDVIPDVVCSLLNRISFSSPSMLESSRGFDKNCHAKRNNCVGEGEANTVVLCSFLLELLHRYPERRTDAVSLVLSKLKENISMKLEGDTVSYFIDNKRNDAFGALCHASVIMIRALPKCRVFVLKIGLVGPIVSCMSTALYSLISGTLPFENRTLPNWMTSAFLLLEVMAQPVNAFSEDDAFKSNVSTPQEDELSQVKSQHRSHISELSRIVDQWITTSHSSESERSTNLGSIPTIKDASLSQTKDGPLSVKSSLFSKFPAYFPLIPTDLSHDCLKICQDILFRCREVFLSPNLLHSVLILLLRLLRSPAVSSQCLKAGFAEAILALPKESSFAGNSSLIALILRRLLEDELTLFSEMEAEIRSAVLKLHAKSNLPKDELPKIKLTSFIEGTSHILCREPNVFFRAMTLVIAIEPPSHKISESDAVVVSLLAPSARSRMREIENEPKCESVKDSMATQQEPYIESKERVKSLNVVRHSSGGKKGRKEKTESPMIKKVEPQKSSVLESPAFRVCGLLVDCIISSAGSLDSDVYEDHFLSTDNLLDILSDLVLALPACASAVHNHRPFRSKEKSRKSSSSYHVDHALRGCPPPPRSFVTFILHFLLPQDRWCIRNDPQLWERQKDARRKESSSTRIKKKKAHRILKISQNAGRLLFGLVLRPGEGRKRVISDIVFALSGGLLGHGATSPPSLTKTNLGPGQGSNSELHALLAWGELCLAIAAPKSNGKNLDGLSACSLESIRLMLESGMVHALLYAFRRTCIGHPMSSSTFSALLLPLEVLTRVSVTDAIENVLKKEAEPTNGQENLAKGSSPSKDLALGSSIVDEEFSSNVNVCHGHHGNLDVAFDVLVAVDSSEAESHDEDDEMVDEDGGSSESSSSDEESGEGHDDESIDESENEDMDDDDDDGSDESDDASNDSNEVDDEDGWHVDNNNSFAVDDQEFEDEEDDEEVSEGLDDPGLDEDWTRIESTGFGGISSDRNLRTGFVVDGELRAHGFMDMSMTQARGFVESAEAMINSLFRNEDISSEALAELEGTLGIRIMRGRSTRAGINDRRLVDALGSRIRGNLAEDVTSTDRSSRNDVVGSVPRVNQRSQPVVGHSGFGRNVPWLEMSAMEYVFGGPSMTGGSRHYEVASGEQNTFDLDDEARFTHSDLQIFPGGAVSAISFRTQRPLHPLLCGVDLPPMNSLVSEVFPQRARASRPGQMLSRSPGNWSNFFTPPFEGLFVSASNGNAVRSNRPYSGGNSAVGILDRINPSAFGWSDDGIVVDSAVQEFRSSLGTILEERARSVLNDVVAPLVDVDAAAVQNVSVQEMGDQENDAGDGQTSESNMQQDETDSVRQTSPTTGSARSDGDGMTSSVAGLRLSAENEVMGDWNFDGGYGARSTVVEGVVASLDSANDSTVLSGVPNLSEALPTELSASHTSAASGVDSQLMDAMPPNAADDTTSNVNVNGLVCPPDVDADVFNSLPLEMQQDCVDQYSRTQELVAQLTGSTLDPEVLAALPEDMRLEIIEQDRQERRMRDQEQEQADPSNAEEMDNASFLASLSPDLREEILLTADESFLSSLPPGVVAEAHILRERATVLQRRQYEAPRDGISNRDSAIHGLGLPRSSQEAANVDSNGNASRRKHRVGKLKVEKDHIRVSYFPQRLSSPFAVADLKALFSALFMLSPIQPARLLQKIFANLCSNYALRDTVTSTLIRLLREDGQGARATVESYRNNYEDSDVWKKLMDLRFSTQDIFPPSSLLGTLPEVPDVEGYNTKEGVGTAASIAANLPKYSRGGTSIVYSLPPVIAARLADTLLQLCKVPRICLHTLTHPIIEISEYGRSSSCFENLLDLLEKPMFAKSASNLEQLLTLFEVIVAPLSHVSRNQKSEDADVSERDIEAAAAAGKEYVDVPDVVISQRRLQLLCSILRMETCMDATFSKVNTIVRRLCRVETNRGFVLSELASVAHALGNDAVRDLKALRIRMENAASRHESRQKQAMDLDEAIEDSNDIDAVSKRMTGSSSCSVTLSTSTSETKLLRVLQTLQVLCSDGSDDISSKKNDSVLTSDELVHILRQVKFDNLWDELSTCLKVVQVLEGVKSFEEEEQKVSENYEATDDGSTDDIAGKKKKLRNSAAGLLTRFLPIIEAFFVANACGARPPPSDSKDQAEEETGDIAVESLVGGHRMLEFVTSHRVLINALIRNNPSLLDKGLRALVQVPRCRVLLDFDVKRQWFKSQVRRLRQQASRRHGSLRLHIRRKSVFEDAYHQLQPRNADEMRGRLHVTFRNEEGVDAGGLSREFFGILAKEMFNPNYALFTSTEDGCTFQPNPNSMINPDHLSYFRFVGRVVGKAVADGFLLDAHFTRSLYKHMLGVQPTHHDMEAIDPDYYRNLKTILEFNLADIGLDLTFSIEDHSFGRSQVIDLIPNGRSVSVTEENKEEYVRLVCQHRMTTSIQSQIKSYLAGFYELVSPELIAIFTPRELELLISGLPDIDVHDLKKNTEYVGWKATDKEMVWFWNILFSLNRNEKASFLQFVTGSAKVPLSGFAELQGMRGIQKFSIHKTGGAKGALMSAHTCFNSLDLPKYDSEDETREKLLYAINEGGGGFLFA